MIKLLYDVISYEATPVSLFLSVHYTYYSVNLVNILNTSMRDVAGNLIYVLFKF